MAEKIGKAVLEISIDDKQYKFSLDQAEKGARRLGDEVKGIGTKLNLLVFKEYGEMAVKAIGAVISKVAELGAHGADVADVKGSFEGLAKGVGETAAAMLGALRQGTQGTVSDFELMQTANKALGAGLKLSAADMGTLAAGAKMLGDRTGRDAKDAFDALTKAMITGRTKGLADFGFAAKDGTSVLGQLKDQLQQTGGPSMDFADHIAAMKTSFANFTDEVSVGIAQSPVLQAAMQKAGLALESAFGPKAGGLVGAIVKTIEGLAIGLTYVGQGGLIAGQVILTAFNAAKTIIGGVLTAVVGVGTGFVGLVAGLGSMATEIPLLGDKLKGFAAGAESARIYMAELTKAVAAETASAASATMGHSEATATLDRMSGSLVLLRDAMTSASATTIAATAAETMAINTHATAFQLANQRMFLSKQELATAFQAFAAQELLLQQTADAAMLAALQQSLAAKAAARGAYEVATMTMASQAGFALRAELEATAQKAVETYNRMKASGLYTAATLKAAWEAAEKAKQAAKQETVEYEMDQNQALLAGTTQILGVLGQKYKAAAIAGAIISTYQAVAKALSSAPWPANLVLAAGALAAGMANVAKIRSSKEGYAEGTPNFDFSNFGAVTSTNLHGKEAVIPQGGGHQLAGEIADAMPGGGGADLDRLADRIIAAPIQPVAAEISLDGRKVGDVLLRLSRTGAVRLHVNGLVTG